MNVFGFDHPIDIELPLQSDVLTGNLCYSGADSNMVVLTWGALLPHGKQNNNHIGRVTCLCICMYICRSPHRGNHQY